MIVQMKQVLHMGMCCASIAHGNVLLHTLPHPLPKNSYQPKELCSPPKEPYRSNAAGIAHGNVLLHTLHHPLPLESNKEAKLSIKRAV